MPRILFAFLRLGAFGAARAADAPRVKLTTSLGVVVVELAPDKAPLTVENFLGYVEDGFYDGTIFHRVISNFMIQGGGFTADFEKQTTRAPIKNEADNGLANDRGTIAMARTGDPHSATAQFFINVVDNDALNHRGPTGRGWGYAVFARVVEGMEVVDRIRNSSALGPCFPEFFHRIEKTPPMANRESKVLDLFGAEPGQEIKINVILDERFCMFAKTNLF